MMPAVRPNWIEMIPISRITVLNPRAQQAPASGDREQHRSHRPEAAHYGEPP
jgi:hypothetical protein